MRIGIDASNIRAGGALNHLVEVLRAVQPEQHSIDRITVWGGRRTLERLPQRAWLHLGHERLLDGPLPARVFWQQTKLTPLAVQRCDLLFVPGGTYLGSFKPFVTMSQNLLPFDPDERRRYGLSWPRVRYYLLERSQTMTFRRAAGVIFLTETAYQVVKRRMGTLPGKTSVVPYGIASEFRRFPQPQRPISAYSQSHPFRLLYVSIVNLYKHQWHVAEAVARLRQDGLPITLELIGPAYQPALARLQRVMQEVDPDEEFIHYRGPVPYAQLVSYYHRADAFVFASSCETFGQILLEAMASGLPIACSNRSAMPEILGEAGFYFDPEQPEEIAKALYTLIDTPALREHCAWSAYKRTQAYSWERCARETFSFLAKAAWN